MNNLYCIITFLSKAKSRIIEKSKLTVIISFNGYRRDKEMMEKLFPDLSFSWLKLLEKNYIRDRHMCQHNFFNYTSSIYHRNQF